MRVATLTRALRPSFGAVMSDAAPFVGVFFLVGGTWLVVASTRGDTRGFWPGYLALGVGLLLVSTVSRAAIDDAGWTACGGGESDFCSASGAWVRRGQGSNFVTRWAPTGAGVFCQAYYSDAYGEKGFGSMPWTAGDACYWKAAETGLYPADAGLGFVAGGSYPGGYVTGYVDPSCLGGTCTGPDGDPSPPEPGASAAFFTEGQGWSMLLAATVLAFAFGGYSVGSRR